jgi:hypothetical protein
MNKLSGVSGCRRLQLEMSTGGVVVQTRELSPGIQKYILLQKKALTGFPMVNRIAMQAGGGGAAEGLTVVAGEGDVIEAMVDLVAEVHMEELVVELVDVEICCMRVELTARLSSGIHCRSLIDSSKTSELCKNMSMFPNRIFCMQVICMVHTASVTSCWCIVVLLRA